MKTPNALNLNFRKMRGGKNSLWQALHLDQNFPPIVGVGNNAQNAERDFQKQFRSLNKIFENHNLPFNMESYRIILRLSAAGVKV